MLDELFQDFRISVRGLLRTPLFAVTVILTLALGIGTNTAIFSIVDRLLLRPLPYPHAEQLVMMHEIRPIPGAWTSRPQTGWTGSGRTSFEDLVAWNNRLATPSM